MSHTPGPWKAVYYQEDNLISIEYDEGRSVATISPSGDYFKEAMANGKILAAAPELLEALKYTIDQLEMIYIEVLADKLDRTRIASLVSQAFEYNSPGCIALRKAEGK